MLSLIIPLYNDKPALMKTLSFLRCRFPDAEIIVVDGGSDDGGPEWVEGEPAVKLIRAHGRGRALQMNLGVAQARGDAFLFLHADTILSVEAVADLHAALGDRHLQAGVFQFQLDGNSIAYRFIEWGVRLRNILFQLPYGDQGLFIRRELFERIGGFPEISIMEDVAIVDRIKKIIPLHFFSGAAITSARRWERRGNLKTTLINWWLIAAYRLGISQARLVEWRRKFA